MTENDRKLVWSAVFLLAILAIVGGAARAEQDRQEEDRRRAFIARVESAGPSSFAPVAVPSTLIVSCLGQGLDVEQFNGYAWIGCNVSVRSAPLKGATVVQIAPDGVQTVVYNAGVDTGIPDLDVVGGSLHVYAIGNADGKVLQAELAR